MGVLFVKVLAALCIPLAAANALSLVCGPLEALKWSSACSGGGSFGAVTWQYSGPTAAPTLTITGTGDDFPEVGEGQYYKADAECYAAIVEIVVTGLTTVGARAFDNLRNLRSVEMSSVVTLGEYAFDGSKVRTTPVLDALSVIRTGAFRNFEGFALVRFAGDMDIGASAFEGSDVSSVDLSATSRLTVGEAAFKACEKLTSFKGGSLMVELPASFFEGCIGLTLAGLSLGKLESVGDRAWAGCTSLEFGFVSEDVTKYIGSSAFEGSGVTKLDLSKHAESFSIGSAVLKDCKHLQTFVAGDMVDVPESFFEGCTELAVTGLVFSQKIRSVGKRAWAGCTSLEFGFISDVGTTSVGESAFEGSGLTKINLLNHAESFEIGASACKSCKNLVEITWSPSYSTMPDSIFEGCSGLTSVDIPATVTSFGEACFRDCTGLEKVTYLGQAEAPSSMFDGCDALKEVTVSDDYKYDKFGGYNLKGLSTGAIIGIAVGVVAFVVIVVVVIVVVLFVTGKIGGKKGDAEQVEA